MAAKRKNPTTSTESPWISEVDKTVRECMRGIRALAGNIAGDVGGEDSEPGARCTGHDKLVGALTDSIVKITDARANHIVLDVRMKKGDK